MSKSVIVIEDLTVNRNGEYLLNNINLTIQKDEQWAIIGHSGSGKTTLAHALTGKIFFSGKIIFQHNNDADGKKIMLVEQQHHFKNLSNTADLYYQQRFNSFDSEDTITVESALQHLPGKEKWIKLLHLTPLLSKPLIQLSNGENKRLQLVKALSANPALLILDNPFIGLDAEGRTTLHSIFTSIIKEGIHLLLITSPNEIPQCITNIFVLENGKMIWQGKKKDYQPTRFHQTKNAAFVTTIKNIPAPGYPPFKHAVQMKNVSVRYGNKTILDNINWTIKKGECWCLSGPNGAGKSTLLSLINADNPQAYANEIYLFDKRRGKGESIWDIKKQIGYVSPELHLFFEQHNSCFQVIASGLFDTIGLFRQLTATQEQQVQQWVNLFNLKKFQHKAMFTLANSEQRIVLLARALIKNPPLLILDEPCQGLDDDQTSYFIQLVNEICKQFGTTLIFVSHYQKDIPACVTHFFQLAKGRQQ
ncbi:MAG: ATP-binding cassette domain-containing protein [Sphingobacteriales bacterium]|nr:MAG: ATP-binding cassette domain-containing protein [Sphingobacteriales bacterium]